MISENGLDLNYILTNPKETGEMLVQLNDYLVSNGHSLDELTDSADIDKDNRVSEKTLLSCGFTLLNTEQSHYIKYLKK